MPHELVVVDRRTRFKRGVVEAENLIRPYDEFNQSLGAHCADWMTGDGSTDTPEAIFASEWLDLSKDRASIKMALKEIAKIDECEWARRMLNALEYRENERPGG